ncbi:MAG: alkaline phosphatase [Prevotella sp.]|jgi:predicted AlkP superfamily pyrophosphatase or phosphodiesterase|nr:alkaline phosphatase [Prevotella sp.]
MKNKLILLFILFICIIQAAPASNVKHVILIGCDGFGAYAYEKADMPNLKKLAENGVWSTKVRTVLPSSSAVNWASILMGASPTLHGYTEWDSKTPEIPSVITGKYGKFPSIYTLLKEQNPRSKTAAIYSWEGIGYLIEKELVDFVIPTHSNEDLTADTAAYIIKTEKPTFTFIHFDEPDHTGHGTGHDTPAYYDVLKKVDERIGKIVQAVKDAGIEKETVIMVVADHGGIDKGHGGKSLQEVQAPLVICGRGMKKGHELESVIVNYDHAATIARVFGLKRPQAWRGQPIEEAFGK